MRSLALVLAALAVAPVANVNVGNWNYGLAAAGGSVWSGGLVGGDVVRVDPSTGKVTKRIPVGFRIFNLASAPGAVGGRQHARPRLTHRRVDGEGHRAREGRRRAVRRRVGLRLGVGVEHARRNRVTGSVSLPGADWVTGYKGSLYVSQESNVVTRVDAKTLQVTGRVKVRRNPLGSAIVRGKLWVPCIDGNAISVVDPATMKVVRTIPDGGGPIVALPSGDKVWVSHTTADDVREYRP